MICSELDERWDALLYGELEPAARRRLERHLEECDACRATHEELERARRALQELLRLFLFSCGSVSSACRATWY